MWFLSKLYQDVYVAIFNNAFAEINKYTLYFYENHFSKNVEAEIEPDQVEIRLLSSCHSQLWKSNK